jgi:hypothetical protein
MIRQFSLLGRGMAAAALLLTLAGIAGGAALAVTATGTAKNVPYVVAYRLKNTQDFPYEGTMVLNFNDGIISGTYTDSSVRPGGPLANRHNAQISGGTSGGNIHFTIGGGGFSFRGTITGDTITGTAQARGRMFEFEAIVGKPGGGR